MSARAALIAMLALCALAAAPVASAQGAAKPLDENDLKEILIWNSPWEGHSTHPPTLYSYRHVFRQRRDVLIASNAVSPFELRHFLSFDIGHSSFCETHIPH